MKPDPLEEFLGRCFACGIEDIGEMRTACEAYVAHYKETATPEQTEIATRLEREWYESLQSGCLPDYSLYGEASYLGELWACWRLYSSRYLRMITSKKSLGGEQSIVDHMKPVRAVADLGCGCGYTTNALSTMFPKATVVGTNLLDSVQAKIARSFGTFRLVQELEDVGTVDVVFASEYFEHIEDPVAHLQDVLKKLQPSKMLIANTFSSPNMGHFPLYRVNGSWVNGTAMSRSFSKELRNWGFVQVKTKLWNSRPSYWVRSS